jgi:hypothetical protein
MPIFALHCAPSSGCRRLDGTGRFRDRHHGACVLAPQWSGSCLGIDRNGLAFDSAPSVANPKYVHSDDASRAPSHQATGAGFRQAVEPMSIHRRSLQRWQSDGPQECRSARSSTSFVLLAVSRCRQQVCGECDHWEFPSPLTGGVREGHPAPPQNVQSKGIPIAYWSYKIFFATECSPDFKALERREACSRAITAPSVTPWRSTPITTSAGGVRGGTKVIANFPRGHFLGWQESCISLF